MSTYQDNRRPAEIENDIERTRAQVSSTIDAIQSKLTPGQMMDQALSYARTSLPADFGSNLNQTIRNNPVPVSLVGIGIAWLMMSGQQPQGRSRPGRVSTVGYETEYEVDYEVTPHAGDTHGEGTMHRAASKASEMGHGLKDKASEMGHGLKDKASDLGHRISDTTSSMTGRARDAAHGTRARVSELGHRSQERLHRTKDQFSHMAETQPLMLGALGLAVGTLLGALLPGTRREDELMGDKRDHLLEKAKETARTHAPAVKESMHRVAQVAKSEAERTAHEVRSRHGSDGQAGPASHAAGSSGSMDSASRGSTTSL